MSEIPRYDTDLDGEANPYIILADEGKLVMFADHQRILADKDSEIERLTEMGITMSSQIGRLDRLRTEWPSVWRLITASQRRSHPSAQNVTVHTTTWKIVRRVVRPPQSLNRKQGQANDYQLSSLSGCSRLISRQ